jgi:hypothetical protein
MSLSPAAHSKEVASVLQQDLAEGGVGWGMCLTGLSIEQGGPGLVTLLLGQVHLSLNFKAFFRIWTKLNTN